MTRTPTRSTTRAPRRATVESALERALADAQARPVADTAPDFADLGLPRPLVKALARLGVTATFPIQAGAIPDALAGRDVLGRAQTGSGKTLAFGLPLLARVAATHRDAAPRSPRGLVLVPTRELAKQVTDVLAPLAQGIGVRITSVYGGAPMGRQIEALRRGADVVVATPGRLVDLIERGACRLDRVHVTVLDEADYMADLGFLPVVTRLLRETPAGGQRLLFSATLDGGVARLVDAFLADPAMHAVAPAGQPVETMDHRIVAVELHDKVAVAAEVAGHGRTLIFVRTKRGADRLAKQLNLAGVAAGAIHGNLTQNARQRALDGFTAGRPLVLVATDVAARGIHVDGIETVVHYDPPADHKDYLHRSGRTARAGSSGTVVSLVQPDQAREVARMHERARVTVRTTPRPRLGARRSSGVAAT